MRETGRIKSEKDELTTWLSVRKRAIPTQRSRLVEMVPSFASIGYRVVSVTGPHAVNLGSLNRRERRI
jgi:hypothetical protein